MIRTETLEEDTKYTLICGENFKALVDYDANEVFIKVVDEEIIWEAPRDIIIHYEEEYYVSLDYYEIMDRHVHIDCDNPQCKRARKAAQVLKKELLEYLVN